MRNPFRRYSLDATALAASILIFVISIFAPADRADVSQLDISSISGDQTRKLLGTGSGVTIGIIDSGIDPTQPAVRGSIAASRDFTSDRTTADTGGSHHLGHGTAVAGLIVGHDTQGGYTGLAPSAKLLNARVANVNSVTSDRQIGDAVFWAVGRGAQIVNLSIGQDGISPITNQTNLMLDYAAERYGTMVVAATNNGNADQSPRSAVQDAPGGQYNGLTIGATGGKHFNVVSDFAAYSLPTDDRTKPDLVAPGLGVSVASANWSKASDYYSGSGTSFAAPIVGGVLAQMIGYGKAHSLSTDPLVLKAALMTSATHVNFSDGSGWLARQVTNDGVDGLTMNKPLDDSQGAGLVDAFGAYQIYAHKTDASVVANSWKKSALSQDKSYTIKLGTLKAGQRIDATLTWLHHVLRSGKGSSGGSYTYSEAASLADFSLTLLRDGKRMVMSDDKYNNVEYLSVLLNQPGTYSLEIYRYAGSGISSEPFALAERVLAASTNQRGRVTAAHESLVLTSAPGVLRSGELVTTPVPEPSGATVAILLVTMFTQRRRRR